MLTKHTRQLQQYTRSTNNSYIQDNLKLATIHKRQICDKDVLQAKYISFCLINIVGNTVRYTKHVI